MWKIITITRITTARGLCLPSLCFHSVHFVYVLWRISVPSWRWGTVSSKFHPSDHTYSRPYIIPSLHIGRGKQRTTISLLSAIISRHRRSTGRIFAAGASWPPSCPTFSCGLGEIICWQVTVRASRACWPTQKFTTSPHRLLTSHATASSYRVFRSKALVSLRKLPTPSRSLSYPSHSEDIEKLFRYTRGRWLYNEREREYHFWYLL